MQKCLLCNVEVNGNWQNDKLLKCSIYSCRNCLIAFTYPQPEQPVYENLDFHLCTKESDVNSQKLTELSELPYDWSTLIKLQTSIIARNLQPNTRIFEIGCGEGILLYELSRMGYNVSGIEPSISAFERAGIRELNIIKGSFPVVQPEGHFDLIIMSQVLEHIRDIEDFIIKIKKFLPGGYLLLTQTNYKGLIPFVQKEKWYGWVPDQHYWHFTLKGLTGFLAKHDFEIVEYGYSSLSHPHNLLYKIAALKSNWQDQFTVLYKLKSNC
jgi:2-polyprenyl-3-methyl-5-hydroxy-6-metoxy-1,4-benzoquinol methylase